MQIMHQYMKDLFSCKVHVILTPRDMLTILCLKVVSVNLCSSPQKPSPPPPPPDWSKEPGKVHFLTNETWEKFKEEHSAVLVMLFSPRK